MIKDVVSVKPHTTIERAAKILLRMHVSAPACCQRYRQTHRKATVFDAVRLAPVASSPPGIVNLIDLRVEDGESPMVKSTGAYRGVSRQVANGRARSTMEVGSDGSGIIADDILASVERFYTTRCCETLVQDTRTMPSSATMIGIVSAREAA